MPPPREDWAAVMDRLLEGDRISYLKWSRLVAGMLAGWRAYDFRDEWPDLVHEILMAAMQAWREGRVHDRSAILAYVRQIARNKFNKRLAKYLEHAEKDMEQWDDEGAFFDSRGDDWPDAERVTEARRALARLPKSKAAVVLHVDGYGRTYEQTAEDLEIPLGTVKRYVREGRAELRGILGRTYEVS